ncbi:hypothetical protein [Sphaerotilus sulfidivorans]|nr:hypothetical protein CQA4T8M7_03150 [Sphaerotilus natans]
MQQQRLFFCGKWLVRGQLIELAVMAGHIPLALFCGMAAQHAQTQRSEEFGEQVDETAVERGRVALPGQLGHVLDKV